MEALPSLPPELVAFAAPMAREPAPLLGSGADETDPAGTVRSFELFLALMTGAQPTGEAWPASGKELPVAAPIAASASQSTGLPAMPAGDAAWMARLGLAAEDAGATLPGLEPLPQPNADPLAPRLPAGSQPAAQIEAAPQAATIADAASTTPAEVAGSLPSELEELASRLAPTDTADAAPPPEPAPASNARAQVFAAEPSFAAPTHARSALGAQDGRPVETASRDAAPIIEVTKLSQTVVPAVAEAAGTAPEWLPPSHTATPSTQAATQPAAAAGAPVDTRTPNWQEAFANRVQWLAGSNGGEARITLNPPELGAVDVKVSLVDDKTYVQMTTATPAARDELSQSLPRLRELFAASGIELGGASVQDGRDGSRGAGLGGSDRGAPSEPRSLTSFVDLADEPLPTAAIPRRSLGRIDLFA